MLGRQIEGPCPSCLTPALVTLTSSGFLHRCESGCRDYEVKRAARLLASRQQTDPEPPTELHDLASALLASMPPDPRW